MLVITYYLKSIHIIKITGKKVETSMAVAINLLRGCVVMAKFLWTQTHGQINICLSIYLSLVHAVI